MAKKETSKYVVLSDGSVAKFMDEVTDGDENHCQKYTICELKGKKIVLSNRCTVHTTFSKRFTEDRAQRIFSDLKLPFLIENGNIFVFANYSKLRDYKCKTSIPDNSFAKIPIELFKTSKNDVVEFCKTKISDFIGINNNIENLENEKLKENERLKRRVEELSILEDKEKLELRIKSLKIYIKESENNIATFDNSIKDFENKLPSLKDKIENCDLSKYDKIVKMEIKISKTEEIEYTKKQIDYCTKDIEDNKRSIFTSNQNLEYLAKSKEEYKEKLRILSPNDEMLKSTDEKVSE